MCFLWINSHNNTQGKPIEVSWHIMNTILSRISNKKQHEKLFNATYTINGLNAVEIKLQYHCILYQHTQEKVHLLIQLAESMLAKGHAHRTELRRCVSTVDKRYRDFSVRMGQYRHLLEMALGGCSQVDLSVTGIYVNAFVN